jgi:hypothetical protein
MTLEDIKTALNDKQNPLDETTMPLLQAHLTSILIEELRESNRLRVDLKNEKQLQKIKDSKRAAMSGKG